VSTPEGSRITERVTPFFRSSPGDGALARSARALPFAGLLTLLCAGCFNAGPYGYDRVYRPLASEQGHYDAAEQLTYQDVLREPNAYAHTEVAWFGVVSSVSAGPSGTSVVYLQLRAHQARHLCREESRDSCRVTVGQADLGAFSVELVLHPEDELGRKRVGPGSLLKVYGTPSPEREGDNMPMLISTYYRHWPIGTYVTTAARNAMPR